MHTKNTCILFFLAILVSGCAVHTKDSAASILQTESSYAKNDTESMEANTTASPFDSF